MLARGGKKGVVSRRRASEREERVDAMPTHGLWRRLGGRAQGRQAGGKG